MQTLYHILPHKKNRARRTQRALSPKPPTTCDRPPARNRPALGTPRQVQGHRPARNRPAREPLQRARDELCRGPMLPFRARLRQRPSHSGAHDDGDDGIQDHASEDRREIHDGNHRGIPVPVSRTSLQPLPRPPALLSVSCSCFPSLSVVVDIRLGGVNRKI